MDANFQITVLTRQQKAGQYDSSVKVLEVDYTSVESLAAALKGIDAVVSTVGYAAIGDQHIMIDAAIAAGVKHFIPSDYGVCTTSPKVEGIPYYAPLTKTRKYLEEKAKSTHLTWTILACGAFLEFVVAGPILLDFTNHKANLYDEGDSRVSSTSFLNVGKAIAASLKHLDDTKNRVIHTSELILTQNMVLSIAKELKPEIKWEITKVSTKAMLKSSLEQIAAGDSSHSVIMKGLLATVLGGEEYGSAYEVTDNELLGIKELTREELKQLVAKRLA